MGIADQKITVVPAAGGGKDGLFRPVLPEQFEAESRVPALQIVDQAET